MTSDPTTIRKAVQVSVNDFTADLPVTPVPAPIHPVYAPARITRPGASSCPRSGKSTDVTKRSRVCGLAGIGRDRQLRRPRHTAISVLAHHGLNIADPAGHANSRMTQTARRHQLGDNDQHRHHRLGQHQPGEDETG